MPTPDNSVTVEAQDNFVDAHSCLRAGMAPLTGLPNLRIRLGGRAWVELFLSPTSRDHWCPFTIGNHSYFRKLLLYKFFKLHILLGTIGD